MTPKYLVSDKTNQAINDFEIYVSDATTKLYEKWHSQDYYMTIPQASVYVLFFRNSHIYDSLRILLSQKRYHGAEFLLRPLYEGVIIFEWCIRDLDSRALRFRRSTFESTAELLEVKYGHNSINRIKQLKEAAKSLEKRGFSLLPDIRQMTDELFGNDAIKRYGYFKYLSKKIHGKYEEWHEYESRPWDCDKENIDNYAFWRVTQCRAMASYLQMRNIELLSELFEPMSYENLTRLEEQWAEVYKNLLKDENMNVKK